MTTSALAKRYARAILDLATEQKQVERVGKELTEFAAMYKSSEELRDLFANPKFPSEARKQVLTELTSRAAVSPTVTSPRPTTSWPSRPQGRCAPRSRAPLRFPRATTRSSRRRSSRPPVTRSPSKRRPTPS